jgi:hypothetical protein
MRALIASTLFVLFPLLAQAQAGTTVTDPNAAPQGLPGQTTGDTQKNAETFFRAAQARCRGVTPARRHQECVAQAMRELDHQPRVRTPSVQVRPASAPEAASAASH